MKTTRSIKRLSTVRSWKKWLWDKLSDDDLRDESGEYFRVAEDRAVMIPMLEMSGTEKARHIQLPIMVYNQIGWHGGVEMAEESEKTIRAIEAAPSYHRL